MAQDSSLQSYDAKTYQRISVGLGFRAIGRERLLARTEVSSRVKWSRANGALVEITGERAVAPAFGGTADFEPQMTTPVPYDPGREALWIGGDGLAEAEVDEVATTIARDNLRAALRFYDHVQETFDRLGNWRDRQRDQGRQARTGGRGRGRDGGDVLAVSGE